MNLLNIKKLNIFFKTDKSTHPIHAVRDLSFHVNAGEMLGVVGESGSGKSITNLALLGILPETAIVKADEMFFMQQNLQGLSELNWRNIRGKEISMIFQDPMTALNPFLSVEYQLTETIFTHQNISKKEAINRAIELLTQVGIASPKERLKAYPFELSGGMAQRVMIAMAISSSPKLLIADEPTTALDVTIQKQILVLLKNLQEKNNMAVILVTHDLGLVAEYSDRIQVMYAGEKVEEGITQDIIMHPTHPYTAGLLSSRPGLSSGLPKSVLPSIPGIVPAFHERPVGCQFHPRCSFVQEDCKSSAFRNPCLHPLAQESIA